MKCGTTSESLPGSVLLKTGGRMQILSFRLKLTFALHLWKRFLTVSQLIPFSFQAFSMICLDSPAFFSNLTQLLIRKKRLKPIVRTSISELSVPGIPGYWTSLVYFMKQPISRKEFICRPKVFKNFKIYSVSILKNFKKH